MLEKGQGGMLLIKYNLDINLTDWAERLRIENRVFILAGDIFGMDKHFRIGIPKDYLLEGLERIIKAQKERFGV